MGNQWDILQSAGYPGPGFLKVGRVDCILHGYAMNGSSKPSVEVRIGTDQRVNRIDYLIVLNNSNPDTANTTALSISDLKVNCGKAFHTFLIDNCQLTINPTDN